MSNYYSILYYNADIWLKPSLSLNIYEQLLSASAAPLKLIYSNVDHQVSYKRLHTICNRATQCQVTQYKHSLLLLKSYNDQQQGTDWLSNNFDQNFDNRTNTLFFETNRYKIGNNLLANRLKVINGVVSYDMLNLSYEQLKIKSQGFVYESVTVTFW